MGLVALKREILKYLEVIWDDEDFQAGVLTLLETEEQARKLLDYLEAGNDDTSNITAVALLLNRGFY